MAEDKRTQAQFEYIELIVAYEGLITNQRLRDTFGISTVQASRVLAAYRKAFPRNLEVLEGDGRGRYGPARRFEPVLAPLSMERYFRAVMAPDQPLYLEDVRRDFTDVDPKMFRIIHAAVRDGLAVRVIYRSMNHPKGRERLIHPLAFAFAGRRWHVRAFDESTGEHRDFNLARMRDVSPAIKSVETPKDEAWDDVVHLELRPHPRLTADQAQLIRDELFQGAAGRRVKTRRALAGYMLKELEVAEDSDFQRPPDYQLYLYKIT
ncbi:MAG: WYL domain-containing protein [Candidatus Thiodiazotropha sp. (ex Myrtea sp. 'scaly one' KF741663)]|nr:WYL domain-containing protein [Candidatus Thiodiazotropha sp. (ex Myrtea sp. 'scaly one' KF741663)]